MASEDKSSKALEPVFVYYKNKLYNVEAFADKHPGGRRVLEKVAGGDIDKFMNGEKRIMGVRHKHSRNAQEMLKRYSMDKSFQEDPLIASGKPILFEVGKLKHKYWQWIHMPYDGRLRLFESELFERMTNTKWYVIPLIWMPLVIYFSMQGLVLMQNLYGVKYGSCIATLLFAFGTLFWTLTEYVLHRFIFHWKPNMESEYQIIFHLLMHGLHHKTPMDSERLVFPPILGLIVVGILLLFYISTLPFQIFCCFATGKLFGYICYDVIHYYLHHGNPRPRTNWHYRKVYHHNHHFKNFDAGYGISTNLWDSVFETEGDGPLQ